MPGISVHVISICPAISLSCQIVIFLILTLLRYTAVVLFPARGGLSDHFLFLLTSLALLHFLLLNPTLPAFFLPYPVIFAPEIASTGKRLGRQDRGFFRKPNPQSAHSDGARSAGDCYRFCPAFCHAAWPFDCVPRKTACLLMCAMCFSNAARRLKFSCKSFIPTTHCMTRCRYIRWQSGCGAV